MKGNVKLIMTHCKIVTDANGNQIVLIPDIIFMNKQHINWDEVETYLRRYIGTIVEIAKSKDIIYLGKKFPSEYTGSRYTRSTRGARAKAKANVVQGIQEIIKVAHLKTFRQNHKEKHDTDAAKGWYYYTTRFALPIYNNQTKTGEYNIYTACLVVNCTLGGKMYLYDLVDIKKEASNPFKINE